MQAVTAENNLSETAFFVPEGEGFRIHWSMPVGEIDLCGHPTLNWSSSKGPIYIPK